MRKSLFFFLSLAFSLTINAQVPQTMSYQAVVRDADNNLAQEQSVGMQISIIQGSVEGDAVFVERHFPTTNANGLVSIQIGAGTDISGDFGTINWAEGPYFIKTETDLNGGANYTVTGISQLLTVPYALYAASAGSAQTAVTAESATNDEDTDPANEIQTLSITGDTLSLSESNQVTLPSTPITESTVSHSFIGLPEDVTAIDSLKINCPTDGVVMITARANPLTWYDGTRVTLYLSTTPTGMDLDESQTGFLEGDNTTRRYQSSVLIATVPVSEGLNTFYLTGQKSSFTETNPVNISFIKMTGVFLPVN